MIWNQTAFVLGSGKTPQRRSNLIVSPGSNVLRNVTAPNRHFYYVSRLGFCEIGCFVIVSACLLYSK